MSEITADVLLRAYSYGVFPMAESREDDELYWVDPEDRGILPLDDFHLPRRLKRTIRQQPYEMHIDRAFPQVMAECAKETSGREGTWINDRIINLYTELFTRGHAHSVEAWKDGKLVGGLYGVAIGGAFFGESMFSRATDASKISLAYLVARLIVGGYALLDTQFVTGHLSQFGAIEVPRASYQFHLHRATGMEADFYRLSLEVGPEPVLQVLSQIS